MLSQYGARPDFVPAEKIDFDISVKNDGNLVHDGPAYSFLSGNGWDEDIISLVVKCGEIGGTVSEQFISGLWEISKKRRVTMTATRKREGR